MRKFAIIALVLLTVLMPVVAFSGTSSASLTISLTILPEPTPPVESTTTATVSEVNGAVVVTESAVSTITPTTPEPTIFPSMVEKDGGTTIGGQQITIIHQDYF